MPTERARALIEMLHDVHSNETAWEIAEQWFLRESRKVEVAPTITIEDPTPAFLASRCPQCGASYDPKVGRWTMPLMGWDRRDQIAREIWSQLLAREFSVISLVTDNSGEEESARLVEDLAKAAVTYADVLIEALDRRL